MNIKDREAYRLAAELAQATGKSLTRVVIDALRKERQRILPRQVDMAKVYEILARVDAMPDLDLRSSSEIVAGLYDERGLPR